MSSMIERVALELANYDARIVDVPEVDTIEDFRFDKDREEYLGRARAAIAAMREPDEGMLAETVQRVGDPSPENWAMADRIAAQLGGPQMLGSTAIAEVARDWQAMIDQALKGEG